MSGQRVLLDQEVWLPVPERLRAGVGQLQRQRGRLVPADTVLEFRVRIGAPPVRGQHLQVHGHALRPDQRQVL